MNRHLTLKQFRYFLAVAESDSVAAASRMLNIAQSAITKSVLELEDAVGLTLFERSTKGMRLTPEGHRFLVKARRVIGAVAEATRGAREGAAPLAGSLSIGVTSLVAGYYLSEVFARFRRTCPAVEVQVVEDAPPFLEHLLINGELDIAIMVSNALGEPQALTAETLTRSPNRVWMAADHPLAAQEEVGLAEIAAQDLVVLQADRIEVLMRSVWARHQLKPRTLLRTSSLEAVRSLVGVGAGLAVLPDFLYRPWTLDAEHVEVRTLRDAVPTVDVGLVWRRGSQPRAEVLEFIEVARDQSRSRRPVA
ncbi:LysR substrate-binding domain-containing protein [uncultured Hydrogenophaga sp.]|jgi:DNA-binding transcriptional LysR family regulator|uniref:LysR substrate-binding domain-containing protein n=1 Tax=uncultured Hydrogenophaga sp. TaxID=199683 RepID=UPI0025907307|nr:LysR substrate-binding domain-containing protein [uncultured Hydrogenophaga sp.]